MGVAALVKSKTISREELEDLAWHVRNAVEQDHKIQPFSTETDLAIYEYWLNAEAIYCMGSVEMYTEQLDANGNPIFEMGQATLYFQFEGEPCTLWTTARKCGRSMWKPCRFMRRSSARGRLSITRNRWESCP